MFMWSYLLFSWIFPACFPVFSLSSCIFSAVICFSWRVCECVPVAQMSLVTSGAAQTNPLSSALNSIPSTWNYPYKKLRNNKYFNTCYLEWNYAFFLLVSIRIFLCAGNPNQVDCNERWITAIILLYVISQAHLTRAHDTSTCQGGKGKGGGGKGKGGRLRVRKVEGGKGRRERWSKLSTTAVVKKKI